MQYDFDRFLRYDELTTWLTSIVAAHPQLATLEQYGTSHEGRALWLVTITDTSTGAASDKPAHWVDANIHSVEVTGGVAALHLISHLLEGHSRGDAIVREALATRTFYVAPRVNPDGVEAALADSPQFRRSSMRAWPWADRHRWPGLEAGDIDGDGRVLQMRIADPNGSHVEHPNDARVMIPLEHRDAPLDATRYRVMSEGTVHDYDGFTIPLRRAPEGLDLNRNFPAGWDTGVTGSGDHPLSEPEIDSLVRAIASRPNICGYHAYHTSGGFLLRPSSTKPDGKLPPTDIWVFRQIAERGTELTGYPAHSVFEDLTWDKNDVMSGAADDWVYEHLGIFGWTTEFWDAIAAATDGRERSGTDIWYVGPTVEQQLAVATWSDTHAPGACQAWRTFDHPQLGPVEIGGVDDFALWTNAPVGPLLRAEVEPHASWVVHQAVLSPRLEILHTRVERMGDDTWRIEAGLANTGWLPTHVSTWAAKHDLVLPITAEISGAESIGGPARVRLGQLPGRSHFALNGLGGTPDRLLTSWIVRATEGATVTIEASHPRAGRTSTHVVVN